MCVIECIVRMALPFSLSSSTQTESKVTPAGLEFLCGFAQTTNMNNHQTQVVFEFEFF